MNMTGWTRARRIGTFALFSSVFFIAARILSAAEIHDAARAGDLAKIKAIVEKDPAQADVKDGFGQAPLHLAAAGGHAAVVEFLVAAGAKLNAECADGRNLLHCAASGGLVGLMERLLKAGFAVDQTDHYGRTPLFYAAEAGSARAAALLLSKGADPKRRNRWSHTPFHEGAFSGNIELLDLLLKNGADIEAEIEDGSSSLFYVGQAGRAEVVDWLLPRGARLDVRNIWGETPISWPLANRFNAMVVKLWPRAEALKDDMKYLAAKAGNVDIAFIRLGGAEQTLRLRPTLVFPLHDGDRKYIYGGSPGA
jgi:ankyrin repeat protein